MTRPYSTILFDLIDTLVRFDVERLPVVRIGARDVRSSAGQLQPVLREVLPGLSLEVFYDAFVWSYREAERRRSATHREVPARERFGLLYERLGASPESVPEEVTDRLLEIHMTCLTGAAVPVAGRPELMPWLAGRYRLGVVSNFDYSPTVERILEDSGLVDELDAVVVSDRVGWRKPSATIFETAFSRLGVRPDDCLFVGDRPDIDVAGAHRVGMDAAWLNPAGEPLPQGLPAPRFDLRGLGDLRTILEPPREDPG